MAKSCEVERPLWKGLLVAPETYNHRTHLSSLQVGIFRSGMRVDDTSHLRSTRLMTKWAVNTNVFSRDRPQQLGNKTVRQPLCIAWGGGVWGVATPARLCHAHIQLAFPSFGAYGLVFGRTRDHKGGFRLRIWTRNFGSLQTTTTTTTTTRHNPPTRQPANPPRCIEATSCEHTKRESYEQWEGVPIVSCQKKGSL